MPDREGVSYLNFYVLGHKVDPQTCQDGTAGFIWGQHGISVPAMVCYDENWGKFLLASDNEEIMNPRLYNLVSKGDNDDLKNSLLPKEFYFMGDEKEDEKKEDDWRIGDLMNMQGHSSDQLDDTEVEIAGEDDFVTPSLTTGDHRFAQIDEDRQTEIIAQVVCETGIKKEQGAISVFLTFKSSLEADLARHIWPRSTRHTNLTVEFFTDHNSEETTSLSVVKKPASSGYTQGYSTYTKYEASPFPEIVAIEGEPAPPCHKTFLSNYN